MSEKSTDTEIILGELEGSCHASFHLNGKKVDLVAVRFVDWLIEICEEYNLELSSSNYNFYYNKKEDKKQVRGEDKETVKKK